MTYLPVYEQNSKLFENLLGAETNQFDDYDTGIIDLDQQLSIDTATWGLNIYEEELGVPTDIQKSYEERRSIIKSKLRGSGKVDRNLIKSVADAWTNGDVEISFQDDSIHVTFTSVIGTPPNIDDVKKGLRDVMPAHLAILYEYAYLLIKDINQIVTLAELQQIKLDKFAGGESNGK